MGIDCMGMEGNESIKNIPGHLYLHPIFALVIYDCSYLYCLAKWPLATSVCLFATIVCSFQEQSSVNITCMKLCNF